MPPNSVPDFGQLITQLTASGAGLGLIGAVISGWLFTNTPARTLDENGRRAVSLAVPFVLIAGIWLLAVSLGQLPFAWSGFVGVMYLTFVASFAKQVSYTAWQGLSTARGARAATRAAHERQVNR